MNVPSITMNQGVARRAYREYHRRVLEQRVERRQALHAKGQELGKTIHMLKGERSRLEKEDEELMLGYKALADGQQVISLPQALRAAGAQPDTYLPALAIAGAEWKECFFFLENNACFYGETNRVPWRQRENGGPKVIRVARSAFPTQTSDWIWRGKQNLVRYPVKALVPSIPPHLRPNHLEKYFVLWEAVWQPAAPVDPLLLKRISRDMFVVVAQWDLTPLERSVLEGRLMS